MKQNNPRPSNSEEGDFLGKESNYSEEGVDLTLIHWMLSMTPGERLHILQQTVRSLLRLRGDLPDT